VLHYYEDYCPREFGRKYVGTTSSRDFTVASSRRHTNPIIASRPIFHARSSHVLSHPSLAHVSFFARVDPRPRRHATTGQGQVRSRPTYRTDRRPALNFIHTPRGRLSVLTRNTKRRSHGSNDMAIRPRAAIEMKETTVKLSKYLLVSNIRT